MDHPSDEHRCTSCGATLPRTGTYCLACDTPVPATPRGLSVAEPTVVQVGRPWRLAVALGTALLIVGAGGLAVSHVVGRRRDHQTGSAAVKAVDVLVRAESGHPGACPYAATTVAGDPARTSAACLRIVGTDPGARIKHLHAAHVHRHGRRAEVDLRGRLRDRSGGRLFEDRVDLVKQGSAWMLSWDDTPIVHD